MDHLQGYLKHRSVGSPVLTFLIHVRSCRASNLTNLLYDQLLNDGTHATQFHFNYTNVLPQALQSHSEGSIYIVHPFSVITNTLVTCTALCVDPVDSCTENCRLFSRAVTWETWLSLSVVFSIKVGSEWWNRTFGIWDQQCRAQQSDVTEAATLNAVERCTGRSPWSRGQPHLNRRIFFFFFFLIYLFFKGGVLTLWRTQGKKTKTQFFVLFFCLVLLGDRKFKFDFKWLKWLSYLRGRFHTSSVFLIWFKWPKVESAFNRGTGANQLLLNQEWWTRGHFGSWVCWGLKISIERYKNKY